MDLVTLLTKYSPANLKTVKGKELALLTDSDVHRLAEEYPFMGGDLLIKKIDNSGVESVATYKSLSSLLKGGHKFKIVGTKYGEPKEPAMNIEAVVQQISTPDFVPIEKDIFNKPKIQNNDGETTTGVGVTRGDSGLSNRRKSNGGKKHHSRQDQK
jgi:hypothetical protein